MITVNDTMTSKCRHYRDCRCVLSANNRAFPLKTELPQLFLLIFVFIFIFYLCEINTVTTFVTWCAPVTAYFTMGHPSILTIIIQVVFLFIGYCIFLRWKFDYLNYFIVLSIGGGSAQYQVLCTYLFLSVSIHSKLLFSLKI